MVVNPPKGMRDFLPEQKKFRNEILNKIKSEYSKNGFSEIETSIIENLENMITAESGENAKLIFKILKRGEKLNLDLSDLNENELSDLALRFDLTLPLSRFYANNINDLPQVCKVFQVGYVFRAERPQKGRYRAFMQCDIDILGDESNLAEIELINTVYKTLKSFNLRDLKVKINDRRILKAICEKSGFGSDEYNDVLITLDKIDKIGEEGIVEELKNKGYAIDKINNLLFINSKFEKEKLNYAKELSIESYDNISSIIETLQKIDESIEIEFDYSLVRGMGYYTSTIFEIFHKEFNFAIAGGGRYDNMIEKISNISVPACGFAIGYERLVDLLSKLEYKVLENTKLALFYDSNKDDLVDVLRLADMLRKEYDVTVYKKKKKMSKQIDRLKDFQFSKFVIFNNDELEIKDL